MANPVFSPPVNPSFTVPITHTQRVDRRSSHKGYDVTRSLALRSLQAIQLVWKVISRPQLDEILSFFEALNGAPGPFDWTPLDNLRAPLGVTPTLGQVAGGSLTSQGTYFCAFTWYKTTGGLETTGSKEASFAVADNNLLTVTVPVFPLTVTEWRVYVGTTTGDAELQAGTETTRTWTMPVGGRVAGGANPPATNTLTGALTWILGADPQETKISANRFSLTLSFLQQIA